jgi:hypothetical protein
MCASRVACDEDWSTSVLRGGVPSNKLRQDEFTLASEVRGSGHER